MKTAKEIEIYQLAPDPEALMQSYVIKTPNGKLVVIDGGMSVVAEPPKSYLPAALRAIAGVGEGEYFEVEAWFLSHPHSDHFSELARALNEYMGGSNYKIKQIYFDFPPFETDDFPYADAEWNATMKLKAGLDHYASVCGLDIEKGRSAYDTFNGAIIHSRSVKDGLTIEIDGVRFEILLTWDKARGSDANNHSLIILMQGLGQKVLFLNDCQVAEGKDLLKFYPDKIKSDIVQMSHHGQDGVGKDVYDAIGATRYLWPTPIWVWNNTVNFRIGETRTWINGCDFTIPKDNHLVACLYKAYPADRFSVESWKQVKNGMKMVVSGQE